MFFNKLRLALYAAQFKTPFACGPLADQILR